MLPQRHRLRHRADFERMRRDGKKVNHLLAVLVFCPNGRPHSRFAFSAGRRVGGAVQRNRAKRLLREAVRARLAVLQPGWDCLLIARPRMPGTDLPQVQLAVDQLLGRAGLLKA